MNKLQSYKLVWVALAVMVTACGGGGSSATSGGETLSTANATPSTPTPVAATVPVTSPTPVAVTTPTPVTSPAPVTALTPVPAPAPVVAPIPVPAPTPIVTPAPVTTAAPNVADCFSFNTANSFTYTDTPDVSRRSFTDPLTGTSYLTTNDVTYGTITHAFGAFKGVPVVVRSRVQVQAATLDATPAFVVTAANNFVVTENSYSNVGQTIVRFDGRDTFSTITTSAGDTLDLRIPAGTTQRYISEYSNVTTVRPSSYLSGSDTSSTTRSATFVAREDVVTPAGTFRNACKVTYQLLSQTPIVDSVFFRGITSTLTTSWHAPGWGIVKSVKTITYSNSVPSALNYTFVANKTLTGQR